MSQTFNVTSCRACPLLGRDESETRGLHGERLIMEDYHCKHPRGGVIGGMVESVRDGVLLPIGCPLKTDELLVRVCPSLCQPKHQN